MVEPSAEGILDPSLLEDKPPEQLQAPRRDFFWDRLVWYAAASIFALAAVDTVFQFVQGATLACNLHNVKTSAAADVTYITNYCYGELPRIQWITVFNVIAGMFILAPHYLWLNVAYGKSTQFFTLANKLQTVPNPKTGMWHVENVLLVKRIELGFSSMFILIGYIVKVVVQLLCAIAALLVALLVFNDGDVNFNCPRHFENSTVTNFWPLNYQVECTFGTLKSLAYLRWVVIFLLIVIILGLFFALMNMTVMPQHALVDSRKFAEFAFRSSLDLKSYKPHLTWRCGSQMSSDMDFHVAELHRASEDLANTFQTVQAFLLETEEINANEMARVSFLRKYARDQPPGLDVELRFPLTSTSYLTITSPNIFKVPTSNDEKYMARPWDPYSRAENGSLMLEQDVRGAILSFVVYCCKWDKRSQGAGGVAVVFKYGKSEMAIPCALARAFKKVILVNFNYQYKNPKAVITKWEYPTAGVTAVTFHPHVLWEKPEQMMETIQQIWEQAPAPPQLRWTRTVEQTWEKALPPQLPRQEEVDGGREAGLGGREITTITKVWEEPPPDETPDPESPNRVEADSSPEFEQSPEFKLGPEFKRSPELKQAPASLKSDLIVLSPMKHQLDKSATTLFLAMLHSRGYLSEEARLLSTYPLTIAGNDVTDEFREYPERKPPEDVQHNDNMMPFQVQPCQHKEKNTSGDGLPSSANTTDGEQQPLVDDSDDSDDEDQPPCTHDLTLKCGRFDCEFRFSLYKMAANSARQ